MSLLLLEEPERLMHLLKSGLYSSQVGFEYGARTTLDRDDGAESGIKHSRGRIEAMAEALRTHPSTTATIDTHVGIGAPSGVAIEYSIGRGAMIAAVLVWQHNIDVSRLRVRAWGKCLCKVARRSRHLNGDAARSGYGWGEIFLELNGVEVPRRPDYYPEEATVDDNDNEQQQPPSPSSSTPRSSYELLSGQALAAKVSKLSPNTVRPEATAVALPSPGGRRAGLGPDALRAMLRGMVVAAAEAPVPVSAAGESSDDAESESVGSSSEDDDEESHEESASADDDEDADDDLGLAAVS